MVRVRTSVSFRARVGARIRAKITDMAMVILWFGLVQGLENFRARTRVRVRAKVRARLRLGLGKE